MSFLMHHKYPLFLYTENVCGLYGAICILKLYIIFGNRKNIAYQLYLLAHTQLLTGNNS